MKASELIELLQTLIAEHGDLEIATYRGYDGGFEPASTAGISVGGGDDGGSLSGKEYIKID